MRCQTKKQYTWYPQVLDTIGTAKLLTTLVERYCLFCCKCEAKVSIKKMASKIKWKFWKLNMHASDIPFRYGGCRCFSYLHVSVAINISRCNKKFFRDSRTVISCGITTNLQWTRARPRDFTVAVSLALKQYCNSCASKHLFAKIAIPYMIY